MNMEAVIHLGYFNGYFFTVFLREQRNSRGVSWWTKTVVVHRNNVQVGNEWHEPEVIFRTLDEAKRAGIERGHQMIDALSVSNAS